MSKSKFAAEDLSRWKAEINPAPIVAKRIKLQRVNNEFLGCCPDVFHKTATGHSDRNPSFTIYKLDDGTWGYKCFACGANGNVFQFVQHVDGLSFPKAVERVLEEAGVEGWQDGMEQTDTEVSLPAAEPKQMVTFPLEQYRPAMAALEHAPEAQAWLRKRGITMEAARAARLGFVQSAEKISPGHAWCNDGWVLFPTFAPGQDIITSVKYRSVVAKKRKQGGKTVSGILRAPNTSTTLYNLGITNANEDIWVVEGEPDAVVLQQAGLSAVAYPMAGYTPSEEESDALCLAKRRFLAGDSDTEGKKAMDKLAERLSGATFRIKWPNNRKDANDTLTNECGNDPEKFKALLADIRERAMQTRTKTLLRTAADIQPRRVLWVWPEKIPQGKLTLFAGNPDNGKSLASAKVAADVSTGAPWPGEIEGHEPADVLMLIGEDDVEDTVIPRLMAAGADLKRVHLIDAVRPVQQDDREVKLDTDIPAIEHHLETNPNIRLLVIDPISNYLGKVSMVAEQEVRSILIPLKRLAEKFNVAVLLVMHLNKKNDLDAISRVGGAMAFIGVARCSWLFSRDKKEEPAEGEDAPAPDAPRKPDTFSMLRIKNNLVSADRSGVAYTIAVKNIPVAGEEPLTIPYVIWGGALDKSADEALNAAGRTSAPDTARKVGRPSESLQKAVKWLSDQLQDNLPKSSSLLLDTAKQVAGISSDTLRKAKDELHVRVFKEGAGKASQWFWVLDPIVATAETVEALEESDLFETGESQ